MTPLTELRSVPEIIPIGSVEIADDAELRMRVMYGLNHLAGQATLRPPERDTTVATVGDSILDVFIEGSDPKAEREGGLVLNIAPGKSHYYLGGGTNVTAGTSGFAREVLMYTMAGPHPLRPQYDQCLAGLPSNVAPYIIEGGSLAVKTRYQDSRGTVLFSTNEVPNPLDESGHEALIRTLTMLQVTTPDIMVVSDYGRGFLTPQVMQHLQRLNKSGTGIPILIDPRPGVSNEKYNVTGAILKPNRDEASILSGINLVGLHEDELMDTMPYVVDAITQRFPRISEALITCDADGAFHFDGSSVSHVQGALRPNNVVNPSGCGDIVAAVFALSRDKIGSQTAIETGLTLAGLAATSQETSTLDAELISQAQSHLC